MSVKKKNESVSSEEKELSFFEKMKSDKKYSAKVQLIGYGVFIVILVVYVNISSMGNVGNSGNFIISGSNSELENENVNSDNKNLLGKLEDNYRYDIQVDALIKNGDNEEPKVVHYIGKSYLNQLEIEKKMNDNSVFYYQVDNRYYSKDDTKMELISDEIVYDVISLEYIEIDDILNLLNKASLDHVTEYSTGKKESIYHLKIKDVIISYQLDDVVEIKVIEENGILNLEIDYNKLLNVIDKNITKCELSATIWDIGSVEKFSILEEETEEIDENS